MKQIEAEQIGRKMNWQNALSISSAFVFGLVLTSSHFSAVAQDRSNPFRAPENNKAPLKPLPSSSIGPAGIDALRLHQPPYNLTGRKIAIGQVEIGRPGQFGIDKAVAKNRMMSLTQVFYRDSRARVNTVDSHAQNVASIMISAAKRVRGVAPNARLFSSAAGVPRQYGQPEECLSTQHVALSNGGDVRAINFSFGESLRHDPREKPLLDGNALLTQCIDWSTRVHNTLYVIAGNQGKGGISIPTDNYNGINVAFTNRVNDVFSRVDFANLGDPAAGALEGIESNIGPRRAIALVAPGHEIATINPNGTITLSSGTSFAAPHVTGVIALLQEYGDRQLRTSCKQGTGCLLPWTLAARQAEVMKAVLLNSSDKVRDQGNGFHLAMSRTIFDRLNRSWFESEAYRSREIPLDIQMGAGQLNAFRAYQQFSSGQASSAKPIPAVGWDYSIVAESTVAQKLNQKLEANTIAYQDYVFEQPLQKDSFISATLVWNRVVELVDKNQNGEYNLGEEFRDRGLNNLNIYLMRAEDQNSAESLWSSESEVDSVEHFFYKIPATGRYKLRVQFRDRVNEPKQPYALAWWAVPAK